MKKIFGGVVLLTLFVACSQPEKQVEVAKKVE
jgi:hypothetical protein